MRKYAIWTALAAILVLGALGITNIIFQLLTLSGITVLVLASFGKKGIKPPPGFFLYLAFIVIVLWKYLENPYGTDLRYLYLFAGGGAVWFSAFNLQEEISKDLGRLIIFLGLAMGLLYFVSLALGVNTIIPGNLYSASSAFKNHNHIGDLWAVVLLLGISRLFIKRKVYFWGLMGLGLYFLFVSYSRSGLLAFAVGAVYLFSRKDWTEKYRLLFISLVVVVCGIFLATSLGKTIFFSRPYFNQAIWGIIHYPQGAGLGNFKMVSSLFEVGTYSSIVHNILLEVLVGVGWLGLVFVVWLVYTLWKVLKEAGSDKVFKAIFLALSVNFMFDSTYAIPTMVWLWFVSLGLSVKRNPGLYRP